MHFLMLPTTVIGRTEIKSACMIVTSAVYSVHTDSLKNTEKEIINAECIST